MGKAIRSAKKTLSVFASNRFLFEELVKRDFEHKYKRTILGMAWSVLSPLLTLLVMKLVFTQFFGRTTPHYTIYLFAGTIVLSFFKEATNNGMTSMISNASVLNKINVPKYLFLFSKNVSSLVNFSLTLIIFFVFCIFDSITFHWGFFLLIYPIACLVILNLGVGMVLSAMYVFFRDTKYLYSVFLTLLTYVSAIFYRVDSFPPLVQRFFLLNPVYVYIKYIRTVVIDGMVPSLQYHALCLLYAFLAACVGALFYKRYNRKFVYYF